jgi:hypothetical protein
MTGIQGLDLDLLGERFAEKVTQYERAGETRDEAARAANAAATVLTTARAKDVQALADAMASGKTAPAPTHEKKAIAATDDAKLRSDAAARAWSISRETLLADVHDHLPEYEATISDAVEDTEAEAREALDTLTIHLRRLQVLRAHALWVQRPVKGEGHIMGPRVQNDAVGPLLGEAEQVISPTRPPSTQADWGIPADLVPDDGYSYRLNNTQPEDADAAVIRDGKGAASVQSKLMEEMAGA